MAESLREQALVALEARLKTMTGTRFWGGGYVDDPVVSRKLTMPVNVTQFPHLSLIEGAMDGPGSTLKIEVSVGRQVGMWHHLKVLLFGYVSADATTSASLWLQRLWADCAITLMAENTLGGIVQAVEWGEGMDTDEGELDPIAAFMQPLTVIISETFTTD